MLREAKNRGSVPECICFDSWYASLENLKAVRSYGWKWVARLAANRILGHCIVPLSNYPSVFLLL